jgi:IS30 family transposase
MSSLKLCDREKIEFYLRCKQGIREIGRLIHRDHGVISREVRRNGGAGKYDAKRAQKMADKRLAHNTVRKLDKDSELKQYVVKQLKEEDWSPKVIAGRLKEHPPPELKGRRVSHESIYQYIYTGEGRYEQLYEHLRRGQPRRHQLHTRTGSKTTITERKSIHLRPMEINNRCEAGHWETDSIIGKKQREIISVQYERKIKLVRIHKLPNKTAVETRDAIIKTIESLQPGAMKSLTYDNGTEGALHMTIRDGWNIETYFCDPYCSWQKGGVEHTNGMIRYYIPKNADLSKLTDLDIYNIQEKLNNRPRESLNFKTPNEMASELNWISGALKV